MMEQLDPGQPVDEVTFLRADFARGKYQTLHFRRKANQNNRFFILALFILSYDPSGGCQSCTRTIGNPRT